MQIVTGSFSFMPGSQPFLFFSLLSSHLTSESEVVGVPDFAYGLALIY